MTEKPFLTVVMPVHDGRDWIGPTLNSLAAEPLDGVEIFVIDSSPTLETAEIVDGHARHPKLQLLRRPDLRSWQSKTNLGVELATAGHVCTLHQDDLWRPGRVQAVKEWIAAAPNAALHLAPSLLVDRNGDPLGRWTCPLPVEEPLDRGFMLERLLVQNFVSIPAPVFSREAWLRVGGLDELLWYTADWDVWIKLASTGPVIYHDQVTTAFRVHGSSLTVTGSRNVDEFRSQMELVLDRHLSGLPEPIRRSVGPRAKASININVSLATAAGGGIKSLFGAFINLVALGPAGMVSYLRDSRLKERVVSRLRAKAAGAF
jgi:glycosyltransferase involved in cell wall biosynthesis